MIGKHNGHNIQIKKNINRKKKIQIGMWEWNGMLWYGVCVRGSLEFSIVFMIVFCCLINSKFIFGFSLSLTNWKKWIMIKEEQ